MFITPAVAGEHVYVGSCAGTFQAVDRESGAPAWSYDTSRDGPSAQFHGDALITGELVVVGSDARPVGHLYAFDRASGEPRWKIPFPGGVAAELYRYGDAVLAVAISGEVWAVELATGHPIWTFDEPPKEARGSLSLDPALGGDRFFVPWRSGAVDAFDAGTGEHLWRRDLGTILNTSVALAEGELVVASLDGRLFRLSPGTGEVLGSFDAGGAFHGDLVMAGGCVLTQRAAGGIDESMEAVGPHVLACIEPGSERVRWRHSSEREWRTSRPLVREGQVIAGGRDTLVALDAVSGAVLWEHGIDGVPRGLGASEEVLYVGTLDGRVLALPMAPSTPSGPESGAPGPRP